MECTNNTGCDWYGSDGLGCENCEPCGGADGCGGYFDEGECILVDGCEWYGWQNGSGCSDDDLGPELMEMLWILRTEKI